MAALSGFAASARSTPLAAETSAASAAPVRWNISSARRRSASNSARAGPSLPVRLRLSSVAVFRRAAEPQLPHARPAHQLRHAVNNDYGLVSFELLERGNESRRILTIHHVNDKNNVRVSNIGFDVLPLNITQRRPKIVSRHPQPETVHTINLALSVLERRQQTRPNI